MTLGTPQRPEIVTQTSPRPRAQAVPSFLCLSQCVSVWGGLGLQAVPFLFVPSLENLRDHGREPAPCLRAQMRGRSRAVGQTGRPAPDPTRWPAGPGQLAPRRQQGRMGSVGAGLRTGP